MVYAFLGVFLREGGGSGRDAVGLVEQSFFYNDGVSSCVKYESRKGLACLFFRKMFFS